MRHRCNRWRAYKVIAVVIDKVFIDNPILSVRQIAQRGVLLNQIATMINATRCSQFTHLKVTRNLSTLELLSRQL